MADEATRRTMAILPSGNAGRSRADSIAALYDAHLDEVYRFVYLRCRDHALTQDVTQETFICAVRASIDPEALTVAWLITVAKRRLFDVLRRRMRHDEKLQRLRNSVTNEETFDVAERIRVEAALAQLPVDYRIVLAMHYFDGYSVSAIAEHLDRSYKSVESLLTRARKALRKALQAEGGE